MQQENSIVPLRDVDVLEQEHEFFQLPPPSKDLCIELTAKQREAAAFFQMNEQQYSSTVCRSSVSGIARYLESRPLPRRLRPLLRRLRLPPLLGFLLIQILLDLPFLHVRFRLPRLLLPNRNVNESLLLQPPI